MAADYDYGIEHLGFTRYREFLVFNIWVPWETGSLLYSRFGIHEIHGVSCIEYLSSVRYREFLVLNIWAVWETGSFSYWTFELREIQGVSCFEHLGSMRYKVFLVLNIFVLWDTGSVLTSHEGLRLVQLVALNSTINCITESIMCSQVREAVFPKIWNICSCSPRAKKHSLYYVRFLYFVDTVGVAGNSY